MHNFADDIPLDLARAAHAGASFVPEQRADQELASYASTLSRDRDTLAKLANTDEKRATLETEFARYRAGYRERYVAMLGAKSRTMSTVIAGPSNFPARRQAKRGVAADRCTKDLLEYRERALDAIRKTLCPELRPIMSGDADAVKRLRANLAVAEAKQAQMTAANAAIRKHARAGADAQVAVALPQNPVGAPTFEAAARLLRQRWDRPGIGPGIIFRWPTRIATRRRPRRRCPRGSSRCESGTSGAGESSAQPIRDDGSDADRPQCLQTSPSASPESTW